MSGAVVVAVRRAGAPACLRATLAAVVLVACAAWGTGSARAGPCC